MASFSSFGRYVDVAAPGVGIYTTLRGGSWGSASGTSFSAPVTAGVIGLAFAAKPSLTPQQAEAILEANADDLGGSGFDNYYGWGRVNAFRAVTAALGTGTPPPDASAPTASIAAPAAGSTVSGTVAISASATDNVGVTELRFYVDGLMVASDTSAPYSAAWNSAAAGYGAHAVAADAYDAAGNRGSAQAISVTVSNAMAVDDVPPSISVTSPSASAILTGAVTIAASAMDNVGVTEVWFHADGQLIGKDSSPPFQLSWSSAVVPDGPHTLRADAVDAMGNWGISASVGIQVSNAVDTTPPSVLITAPSGGATLGVKTTFTASASDASGIAQVEFLVDGLWKATDTAAPWTFSAMTKKWTPGTHTVSARAVDGNGLSGMASITVVRPQSVKGAKSH